MKASPEKVHTILKVSVILIFSLTALLMFWSFLEAKKILDNCLAQGNSRSQCQEEVRIEKERRKNL